jgi:hypothetical protein
VGQPPDPWYRPGRLKEAKQIEAKLLAEVAAGRHQDALRAKYGR